MNNYDIQLNISLGVQYACRCAVSTSSVHRVYWGERVCPVLAGRFDCFCPSPPVKKEKWHKIAWQCYTKWQITRNVCCAVTSTCVSLPELVLSCATGCPCLPLRQTGRRCCCSWRWVRSSLSPGNRSPAGYETWGGRMEPEDRQQAVRVLRSTRMDVDWWGLLIGIKAWNRCSRCNI